MTRKRLIAWGLVAACVCLSPAVIAWLPIPGVTSANFDRIEKRMTKADVEAVFGNPPFKREHLGGGGNWYSWRTEDERAAAVIVFDDDDRVSQKFWVNSSEALWDKIRRWLRLP
jgi:hypothetical protein